LIEERLLIPISWVAKPTEEITKVPLPGALMLNCPAVFVCVALDVPFTCTVAPTRALSPEVTLPLTVVCAKSTDVESEKVRKNKNRNFRFRNHWE
jgi:hypothetical protein